MKNRPKTKSEHAIDEHWDSASDLTLGNFSKLAAANKLPKKTVRPKSNFLARGNLLTRSVSFIKEYAGLSIRSEGLGHSDDYFKSTLRQYDDFEVVSPTTHRNKPTKRPKTAKPKKKQVGQGDYLKKQKFVSISESTLTTPRTFDPEEETDVFYSPNSCYLYSPKDFKGFDSFARGEPNYTDQQDSEKKVKQVEHVVTRKDKEYQDLDIVAFEQDSTEDFKQSPNKEVTQEEDTFGEKDLSDHSTIMAEEEGDPMGDTEEMVKKYSEQIAQMEEDNKQQDDEQAVLKEVEECEAQCMEIYKILNDLKQRVQELLSKPSRTPQEDQELEAKQKQLNDKMALLEQKTRRIELLVGKTKKADFSKIYDEDTLPKVVVCGLAENSMPKFIICDDKKRPSNRKPACSPLTGPSKNCPNANLPPQPFQPACLGSQPPPCPPPPCCPPPPGCPPPPCPPSPCPPPCPPPRPPCRKSGSAQMQQSPSAMYNFPQSAPTSGSSPCPPCGPKTSAGQMNTPQQFVQRLTESYEMQERLAQENADLECKRYQLQEDLLTKEQTLESLQRQLQCMQHELRQVVKENNVLNCKLEQIKTGSDGPCPPCKQRSAGGDRSCSDAKPRQPCGPGKGPCPADDDETRKLEKQLTLMEMEVKAIQNELTTVRQERLHLEQHRRMLAPMTCPPPCMPPRNDGPLRELREKYNCLQDDYKSKLTEVAGLRADVDKFKSNLQEVAEGKKAYEEKIRELERLVKESKDPKAGLYSKENYVELESQLLVAKQRFRESQDELDELRALTEEQQCQLKDYRNKYLEAQQQVEEQKRQMDLMELENSRIGEQVNLEIQRVKNQFQEKLQELTPLPDILKATQLKLQEAQQMHLMAERNNEALLREIQNLRDKAVMAVEQMEANKSGFGNLDAERQSLQDANEELDKQVQLLQAENDDLRKEMERMHDEVEDAEKRAQEKLHEIAQLSAEVDNVRDESARQVSRVKDRCETVRRSMQNQICDLEKQLAQSRAQAKSAQRDRDDIRQKMQSQINNLNENFEDAQMRIRTLQGHVNFLKNSAAVYPSIDQMPNRNCQ